MLNNVTILLRMRDAVAKLMEKCEKISTKMETMVEELTNENSRGQMDLTVQPKNINQSMKLTEYQMIG
jgi:archaellum component FlaC